MIERIVPSGISFFGDGTMTVLAPLRYLAWLPRCDTDTKPWRSRILTISFEDRSLGTLEAESMDRRVGYFSDGALTGCIFQVELKRSL